LRSAYLPEALPLIDRREGHKLNRALRWFAHLLAHRAVVFGEAALGPKSTAPQGLKGQGVLPLGPGSAVRLFYIICLYMTRPENG